MSELCPNLSSQDIPQNYDISYVPCNTLHWSHLATRCQLCYSFQLSHSLNCLYQEFILKIWVELTVSWIDCVILYTLVYRLYTTHILKQSQSMIDICAIIYLHTYACEMCMYIDIYIPTCIISQGQAIYETNPRKKCRYHQIKRVYYKVQESLIMYTLSHQIIGFPFQQNHAWMLCRYLPLPWDSNRSFPGR